MSALQIRIVGGAAEVAAPAWSALESGRSPFLAHCLQHGLRLYEAGAQGEHKIARGFLPVPIRSAHWIADPGLDRAVEHFLRGEREHSEAMIEVLRARKSPFRDPGS